VHYVSYGTLGGEYTSQCRAAVITEVRGDDAAERDDAVVDLCVMNPTGLFFNVCPHDADSKAGGTWHWPERVED